MTILDQLTGLFVGAVRRPWPGRPPSAITKVAVDRSLELKRDGFVEDEQADLKVHGGAEKAVHHYPQDHYAIWDAELGPNDRFRAGGFGENVSTLGLTEDDVCIGDVFALGAARVQVSQGRQPCWKLSAHTGIKRMAYHVQRTARTGWYYRVLEEGHVAPDDELLLLDRPQPDWSVRRVTRARFDKNLEAETARVLASMPELAGGWRDAFDRRAVGTAGDETVRLNGAPARLP